jgi:imidazoleglycerol-phosphate dehydratase
MRTAEIERNTNETSIFVNWNLDGTGKGDIETGIPFMDHMLTLFARHGGFDLTVRASGDLDVDCHHTMEDLGLTMGHALTQALGAKEGIRRYGSFLLPMDESLALVALDLSGRPFLVYDVEPPADRIKDLDTALFKEFFQAFAVKGGITLHIRMLSSGEVHHVFEAIFKGLSRSLAEAVSLDPRVEGVPSTKGVL